MNGRTIRVQYRELHQKLVPNPSLRPQTQSSSTSKSASHPRSTRTQQGQPHSEGRKVPTTLGQLSGNGGIGIDALNGFGGFDPITGIANSTVYLS